MSRSSWKGLYVDPSIYTYNLGLSKTGKQRNLVSAKIASTKSKSKTKGRKVAANADRLYSAALFKLNCRSSTILPEFVGKLVMIHNGDYYKKVMIKPNMEGHRFGEFSLTRKPADHTKKNKTLNKSKAKSKPKAMAKTK